MFVHVTLGTTIHIRIDGPPFAMCAHELGSRIQADGHTHIY